MPAYERPRVVISRCLEFSACRYDGQAIPYELVTELTPFVEWIPVCPEVEIGLGVPRDPIRIIETDGEARLVQPSTERDLTDVMRGFTAEFLDGPGEIDGFILKSRSPSCGIRDVKAFRSAAHASPDGTTRGFFGGAVVDRFPNSAVEDEERLRNHAIREHFLTKLFARARFRAVAASGSIRALADYHAHNELLLTSYGRKHARELGRLVASHEGNATTELFEAYGAGLGRAMARTPRYASNIDMMMHVAGLFSEQPSREEQALLQRELTRYRERRVPLSTPLGLLKSWAARFDDTYLRAQSFLERYPEELLAPGDSRQERVSSRL